MTEELALAILVSAVGYARREVALREAGSATQLLSDPRAFARTLGESGLLALRRETERADALRERLSHEQVHLVARGAQGYPPLLAQIARPPHLLFVLGEARLDDACPIAAVGTRRASEYGLRHTRRIAGELAAAGACVVSGLALGVDAAAHQGALDAGGRTVAVLGGALDEFYPAGNRPLMRRILDAGGSVITEYAPGFRPTRYSFLERNRIIAGMSLGVLVTEGPMRSGALRTAQSALDEGREVFALPGSVDSALSALPNRLIAEGAHVATSGRDILDTLVADAREIAPPGRPARGRRVKLLREEESGYAAAAREKPIPSGLGEQESAVLRALAGGEADFDSLCERTRIPADDLGAVLTLLEMDGLIVALSALRYARA